MAPMPSQSLPTIFSTCKCIGGIHRNISCSAEGLFGTVMNVFDKAVNIKTNEDKLLVISVGTVRSPLTINVGPLMDGSSPDFSFNPSFLDIVQNGDQVHVIHKPRSNNESRQVSNKVHIRVGKCVILVNKPIHFFENDILKLKVDKLEKFIDYRQILFSVLRECAFSQQAGSLLNPDTTTEGLLPNFLNSIQEENHGSIDISSGMFTDKLSRCLLGLCGRGPGFTPAGDDFIGGFLAIINWIRISLKIGLRIVPGLEYRKLTTWTSFKLMECNAHGLVDIEIQDLINSIARGDVLQYIDSVRSIAKRGHTSGIDFATGATVGLYLAIDSLKP